MKNLFFLICLISFLIPVYNLSAQNPARAIIHFKDKSDDGLVNMILDEIDKKVISQSGKHNLVLYHGEETKSNLVPHPNFVGKERPCGEIIFFKPNIWFDHSTEFGTVQDTSGKTIQAFFKMNYGALVDIKSIDLASSRILKFSQVEILKPSEERMDVKDFVKEFGGDPVKISASDPTKYRRTLEKLKKEYKQKIYNSYKSKVESQLPRNWFQPHDFAADEKVFEAIPPKDLNVKRIKDFKFKGGNKDNLVVGRIYLCLVKKETAGYHYYENLTRVRVKEIGENESTMTTLLLASKDLAESFKKGEKVLLVPDDVELVLNQLNNNKKDLNVSLALEKNCIFCAVANEKSLLNTPVFTLIERAAPQLNYFAELSKQDDFIDFSVEDLQGKKVGLDLYLVKRDKYMEAIEVATNKTVASVDLTLKVLGLSFRDVITTEVISQLLNSYKPQEFGIDFIKVLQEKKDRVERVLAYDPIGFDRFSKYDIYTLVQEKVDGELINRKNIIGQCTPAKLLSSNLAELKINKGEKAVFGALKQNQKIYFTINIKS